MHIILFYLPAEEKILYLTPEQEKDKSHFTDKEVFIKSWGLFPPTPVWSKCLRDYGIVHIIVFRIQQYRQYQSSLLDTQINCINKPPSIIEMVAMEIK